MAQSSDFRQVLLDELRPHFTKCKVHPAGSYLVGQGEVTPVSFVVLRGVGAREKITNHGNKQILAFVLAGELIDTRAERGQNFDHSVRLLTVCEIGWIANSNLSRLEAASPSLARFSMLQRHRDISTTREWLLNVGQRTARSRVAHLLCELWLRFLDAGMQEGRSVPFPMTQNDLASATGLTSVHINRTLQGLRAEGMIDLVNKRLTVNDPVRLMRIAGFSEGYLQRDNGAPHEPKCNAS